MPSPHIQFRAIGSLETALSERTQLYDGLTPAQQSGLLSETARRDLDRYYEMLQRSLPSFSEGEAMLLCDVFNGTLHMPYSVQLIWAEVSDALCEGYAEKWGIDGPAFVERLRQFTPFECMAVVDAIEQAWNSPTYRVDDMVTRVRKVGLVRENSK